ncbi:hypothetical protein CCR97_17995 [Rhodoplanes elegans]|uniref:WGR domain-containing protein n=1 Tax=Rhodoplanes elegans TaxID=29408 RepID=A0A327K3C4_9BRAD|nr:WGR domain-containing protein [Rhodoplanes elegans]MBK5960081.1 hypothetical protein [Rhodoplanes elegans]RAI32917.1 hypothetical protein CH338_23410 [Rhodoplanes elegans]
MSAPVVLHRVDPSRNMARFYLMDVQPDLFGGWSFIREWGRIGRGGTLRALPCPTQEAAQAALEQQRQAKERRGYAPPIRE